MYSYFYGWEGKNPPKEKTPKCSARQMVEAVDAGDLSQLRRLISLYGTHKLRFHLLCRALWYGKRDIAKYLLDNVSTEWLKSQLSASVNKRHLPLHLACSRGYSDIVVDCVRAGVDVNHRDRSGRTPLYYTHDPDTIKFLLSEGASADAVDELDRTPLHYVLTSTKHGEADRLQVVKCYRESPAPALMSKSSLLHDLLDTVDLLERKSQDSMLVRLLEAILTYWPAVDLETRSKTGETALYRAVRMRLVLCSQLLIAKGADVHAIDSRGLSVLNAAGQQRDRLYSTCLSFCCDGQVRADGERLVDMLLDSRVDLLMALPGGKTVLEVAMDDHMEQVEDHVQNKIEHYCSRVDEHGNSLLHIMCRSRTVPPLAMRVIDSSSINSVNHSGESPLHVACRSGGVEWVEQLVRRSANVLALNDSGQTALDYCLMAPATDSTAYYSCAICAYGNRPYISRKKYLHSMWCFKDRPFGAGQTLLLPVIPSEIASFDGPECSLGDPRDVRYRVVDWLMKPENRSQPVLIRQLFKTCVEVLLYYEKLDSKNARPTFALDTFLSDAVFRSVSFLFEDPEIEPQYGRYACFAQVFWLYWDKRHEFYQRVIANRFGSRDEANRFQIVLCEAHLAHDRCRFPDLTEFKLDCEQQVAAMKSTSITDAMSVYDYLHDKHPASVRHLWQHPTYLNQLELPKQFPIYADLIRTKIWRDSMRIHLLPMAKERLVSYLAEDAPLRQVFAIEELGTRILVNLSNVELLGVIWPQFRDMIIQE